MNKDTEVIKNRVNEQVGYRFNTFDVKTLTENFEQYFSNFSGNKLPKSGYWHDMGGFFNLSSFVGGQNRQTNLKTQALWGIGSPLLILVQNAFRVDYVVFSSEIPCGYNFV